MNSVPHHGVHEDARQIVPEPHLREHEYLLAMKKARDVLLIAQAQLPFPLLPCGNPDAHGGMKDL